MEEQFISFPAIQEVPASAWHNLSHKRILFGHQSVGYNIVEGMEELIKKNPQINLNIIENPRPWEVKSSGFIHFQVGENMLPQSKIDAFSNLMGREMGQKTDIAFFKFCYVDILPNTDVVKVFTQYKTAMEKLSQAFPNTIFVHVTVPLESEPSGINKWKREVKSLVKKSLHMSVLNGFVNVKRNEFNELLRKEYEGRSPIFDLAKIESTFPNGSRQVSSVDGKLYFSLVSEYTTDGGHLNELGRQTVAEQLLIFLARLSE